MTYSKCLIAMSTVPSSDIDECFNSTICGPDSVCTNTPGAYTCACQVGFTPIQPDQEPSETNICLGIFNEALPVTLRANVSLSAESTGGGFQHGKQQFNCQLV